MEFTIKSEAEWSKWIPIIFSELGDRKIICLYGGLGVGKTTFMKHLGDYLDVIDEVTSPTFAIANRYKTNAGDMINHLDLYRLANLDEVIHIGFEEYLADEHLTVIEWPELAEVLIGTEALTMKMEVLEDDVRKIVLL